ncbi:MAG: hypothetical protein U1F98_04370 [Verrucomicrobiota bacterium]
MSRDPLDRLLRSAKRAKPAVPDSLPFGLEARVLSEWRRAPAAEDVSLALLFRRAIVCASLIMALSAGCYWVSRLQESPSKTVLTNYVLTVQLEP